MSGLTTETGSPINLSGSGAISLRPGFLLGFYVNSTSSGVLTLQDGGSGGASLCGNITPAIGFHRFPSVFRAATGPYFTLVSGSINVTFFFAAG